MNKKDKLLESWAEESLRNLSLESPSSHFAEDVMMRLNEAKAIDTSYFKYRPLINKPVWAILALGLIGLISILYFSDVPMVKNQTPTWMHTPLTWFQNLDFKFPDLTVSSSASIAILVFSVLLLIEIPIIQKLMERRMNGQM